MPVATPYRRKTSFTDHSAKNPDVPQPGAALDIEFDATGKSLREVIEALGAIEQDDRRLQPEIVYLRNLAPEVFRWLAKLVKGEYTIVPADPSNPGGPGTPGDPGGSSYIGVLNFRGLLDTPDSYAGHGGKILKVALTEDGIDFFDDEDQEIRVQDATDVPDFEGNELRFWRVNAARNAVEFVALPIDPDGKYARLDAANDFDMNAMENMVVGRYHERVRDLGNVSGIVSLDPKTGCVFSCTLTGATTFQFTQLPPAGQMYSCSIFTQSPASTSLNVAGGDWGYEKVLDNPEGTAWHWEQSAPPTVPAGSFMALSVAVLANGKIKCGIK